MEVSARIVTLELAETFVISRSASDTEDVLVVELRHSGVSGFGEAQPIDHYGESVESAQAYVEEHGELLGDDPFSFEEVMERLPAREFAADIGIDEKLGQTIVVENRSGLDYHGLVYLVDRVSRAKPRPV